MIVVAPTVTEQGLPGVISRVTDYIAAESGDVEGYSNENPWGRRRLAYPIQNFTDAFYVLYYFHAEPGAIDEIERSLRLDEQVIRHLIVRYDPMADYLELPSLKRLGEEEVEIEIETDGIEEVDETAADEAETEAAAEIDVDAVIEVSHVEDDEAEDELLEDEDGDAQSDDDETANE